MKQWWLRFRGYEPVSIAHGRETWGDALVGHFTSVLCRHPRTGRVATFTVDGHWQTSHFVAPRSASSIGEADRG